MSPPIPLIGTAARRGWRIPIERVEHRGGAYARCEPPGGQAVASRPRPHDLDDSTLIDDIAELLGDRWTCELLPWLLPYDGLDDDDVLDDYYDPDVLDDYDPAGTAALLIRGVIDARRSAPL